MKADTSNSGEQVEDGVSYKYSSNWIHQLESEDHWRSYWRQADLLNSVLQKGDTILEIGPGTGFISNYLKSRGYQVTTLDIDEAKSPDIVTNIVKYEFPDPYDYILAFEVFEHIPFQKFVDILPRLRNATRKGLVLSVPRNYRIWFHADLIIPFFKSVSFGLKIKRRRIIEERHFWELDYKDFSEKNLLSRCKEAGLNPWITRKANLVAFFVLRPE
jgi:SAM-dependent methyltransferase